jgi:hypothetical protein
MVPKSEMIFFDMLYKIHKGEALITSMALSKYKHVIELLKLARLQSRICYMRPVN